MFFGSFQATKSYLRRTNCALMFFHVLPSIMAGCTIFPLAFTKVMEVIIRASKWVIGGERLTFGTCLPLIRAFMDDLTTITTTASYTRCLWEKLQENISPDRMKFRPSKSRSIKIVKGKLTQQRFYINQEPFPTVSEKPIKSLGRWYNSKLKDSDQIHKMRQGLSKDLETIDRSLRSVLRSNLRSGAWNLGYYPALCDYSRCMISLLLESKRWKWLGVPCCLSSIALYGHGLLKLLLSSVTEKFKCTKVRL